MESILTTTLPSYGGYQSAQLRAKLVIGALSANIVMVVLDSILGLGMFFTGSLMSLEDTGMNLYAVLMGLYSLGNFGVYVATAVLFMMWFHRVYKNLTPLGAVGLQYSPGWTIGAWFIPFGSLFIPLRIAKEVWVKSGAESKEFAFLYTESTTPACLSIWWGCWIASNILTNVATKIVFAAAGYGAGLAVALLANGLSVAAALYAMQVVRAITAHQEENIAQRSNYGAPPPPPVYEALAA